MAKKRKTRAQKIKTQQRREAQQLTIEQKQHLEKMQRMGNLREAYDKLLNNVSNGAEFAKTLSDLMIGSGNLLGDHAKEMVLGYFKGFGEETYGSNASSNSTTDRFDVLEALAEELKEDTEFLDKLRSSYGEPI